MLGSIGTPELLVIFVIALVVFGPRRLPELGRSVGRAIGEFKRAGSELQSRLEREVELDAKGDTESGIPPVPDALTPEQSQFSDQLSRTANGDFS